MAESYTREDWEAWLVENSWDADLEAAISTTFGFQVFVIGRRAREVGGAFQEVFDRFRERIDRQRAEFVRRYFSS